MPRAPRTAGREPETAGRGPAGRPGNVPDNASGNAFGDSPSTAPCGERSRWTSSASIRRGEKRPSTPVPENARER